MGRPRNWHGVRSRARKRGSWSKERGISRPREGGEKANRRGVVGEKKGVRRLRKRGRKPKEGGLRSSSREWGDEKQPEVRGAGCM